MENSLTPTEQNILDCLKSHQGEIVSKDTILQEAFSWHFDPRTNIVQVGIFRLRSKLIKLPDLNYDIWTFYGKGYKLVELPCTEADRSDLFNNTTITWPRAATAPYNIPNTSQSIAADYEAKIITLREAALELHKANLIPYVSEKLALDSLKSTTGT